MEGQAREPVGRALVREPRRVEPAWCRGLDTNEALFHAFNARGAFLTGQLLRVDGVFNEAQLRAALMRLSRRHPRLAARIVETSEGPRWERGRDTVPLRVVRAWAAGTPERVLEDVLHRPMDAARDPLFHVTWVAGAAQQALIFATHHSLADGRSAHQLAVDLVDALNAVLLGRPSELAPPPGPPIDACLPDDVPLGARVLHRLSRLRRRLGTPMARRAALERRAPLHERHTRVHLSTVPAIVVSALQQRAREEGASMNGALTAALLRASARVFGLRGSVTVSTQVSLRAMTRPRLAEEVVGCYAGRVVTEHTGRAAFWRLARECSSSVRAALRRHEPVAAILGSRGRAAEVGQLLERELAQERPSKLGLAISNRGRMVSPRTRSPLRLVAFHSAVANHVSGSPVQLSCGTVAGALHCSLVYVAPIVSERMAHELWGAVLAEIERAL